MAQIRIEIDVPEELAAAWPASPEGQRARKIVSSIAAELRDRLIAEKRVAESIRREAEANEKATAEHAEAVEAAQEKPEDWGDA